MDTTGQLDINFNEAAYKAMVQHVTSTLKQTHYNTLHNVALVCGPCGVGKSFLLQHVAKDVAKDVACKTIVMPTSTAEDNLNQNAFRNLLAKRPAFGQRADPPFQAPQRPSLKAEDTDEVPPSVSLAKILKWPYFLVLDDMDSAIPSGHHWSTGGNLKKNLLLTSVPVFLVCQDVRCNRLKVFRRANVRTIFVNRPTPRKLQQALVTWYARRWDRVIFKGTHWLVDVSEAAKKAFYYMACEARSDVRRALLMLDLYKPHSSYDETESTFQSKLNRMSTLRETNPFVLLQSLFNTRRPVTSLLEGLERQTTSDVIFAQLLMFRNYLDVYAMPHASKRSAYQQRLEQIANTADRFSLSDTFHLGDEVVSTMQLMPYKTVLSLVQPARDSQYTWNARRYVRANGLSTDPSATHVFGKQMKQWRGAALRCYNMTARATDLLPTLRMQVQCTPDLKLFVEHCAKHLGLNTVDLMKALVVEPQKAFAIRNGHTQLLSAGQKRTLTTLLNAYHREHTGLRKASARTKRKRNALK